MFVVWCEREKYPLQSTNSYVRLNLSRKPLSIVKHLQKYIFRCRYNGFKWKAAFSLKQKEKQFCPDPDPLIRQNF